MNAEVMRSLDKVCRRIASKYFIPGYETEDIYQEAYVIGLEILEKYDPSRGIPVENFLNVSVNNRFQNFIRLKSENKKNCGCIEGESCKKCIYRESKARVIYMKQLEDNADYIDDIESHKAILQEILPIIDLRLPVSMRDDWRRILDNSHVVRSRKFEILEAVRTIVKQYDDKIDEKRNIDDPDFLPIYEFGWETEIDKVTQQPTQYFFIENDLHLAKVYLDEEASVIWLSELAGEAREVYMKIKNNIDVDNDDVAILAKSITKLGAWDV